MKIVLVGGGTGGHFYPLIAVAEAIHALSREKRLVEPTLYYLGPEPFDEEALLENNIEHHPLPAGKLRRYGSILNILDLFKTALGIVRAGIKLFDVYPDVVFSTGGYAAFPTLFAARLLAIPVFIYDADAKPGRVSAWAASFAKRIALAHPEAAGHFPEKVRGKIARTGHPIRKEVEVPAHEGGVEFLKLEPEVPVILVLGGSLGARAINEVILGALPLLVEKYSVVHQCGATHFDDVSKIAAVALRTSPHADRYRPFPLLNTIALRMAAGAASLVVARAGSGSIFEIASWGVPAIFVPIPPDVSHDQTENAFSYARSGAAVVIEQNNLTPHLLMAEIDRLIADPALRKTMSAAAHEFARPGAANTIASAILEIARSHEPS
jgi:UDP-N-acetylglucosamine--N-acetylmuramyl-(pentapeptide) pyrophosphoryl-undecaprenol N-acetylglucosamine transferase